VRELPPALRLYLLVIYAVCAVLFIGQVGLSFAAGLSSVTRGDVLWPALLFVALAYVGERTGLRVSASVYQGLATPVHIAAILLLPAPLPLLVAVVAVAVLEGQQGNQELYKRLFNICHQILSVGGSTLVLSLFVAPTAVLRVDGGPVTVLYIGLLLAVYYLLDTGTLAGVLALLERRPLLEVWRDSYRQNVLPELATSAIGVLSAAAWRFNPGLLVLVLLPVLALRAAFQAIAEAERARGVARDAQALAEEALRVRDDFMNAASHDLRTPLTGVMGRSDLIQTRLDSGRPLDEGWFRTQVDLLRQSARRMAATVEEITDAAQLQMGRPLSLKLEPIDIGDMVRGMSAMVAAASTWNNAAPVEVAAAAGIVVEGDRRRLERVVQNVVGNAVKYSPDGTPVGVSVDGDAEWATITVRDRGVGVPADELPRLFTRFYRASTSKGIAGTGIGLAGSRTIVEQHGGRITLESAVGEGTTVTVSLPREAREGDGAPLTPNPSP
jgi:signal transduction histidine kinase